MQKHLLPYTTWMETETQKEWVIMELSNWDDEFKIHATPQFIFMYRVGDYRKKRKYNYADVLQRVLTGKLICVNIP